MAPLSNSDTIVRTRKLDESPRNYNSKLESRHVTRGNGFPPLEAAIVASLMKNYIGISRDKARSRRDKRFTRRPWAEDRLAQGGLFILASVEALKKRSSVSSRRKLELLLLAGVNDAC